MTSTSVLFPAPDGPMMPTGFARLGPERDLLERRPRRAGKGKRDVFSVRSSCSRMPPSRTDSAAADAPSSEASSSVTRSKAGRS
jgi:hypothetical protein